MSWQTYVDDHLMVDLPGGGKLAFAAIYGQDGGCWAQSAGFPAVSLHAQRAERQKGRERERERCRENSFAAFAGDVSAAVRSLARDVQSAGRDGFFPFGSETSPSGFFPFERSLDGSARARRRPPLC